MKNAGMDGAEGRSVLAMPGIMRSAFGFPDPCTIVFGVFGSVYVAFGLRSILG